MYLVTGGCGFIGSHIVEALVARGETVRVFDNLSTGHERNLAAVRARVELVRGDTREPAALAAAMQGVRHVFHEAALVSVADSVARPADNHGINLTATLNVLLAARDAGVRRVVFASSAATYGDGIPGAKREDQRPQPASPYGLAKLASEYYLTAFAQLYGIETVSLRYFNVYGPRQDPTSMYAGVIASFAATIAQGRDPIVFGDGRQTRDFVFVRDVVAANLRAAAAPGVGRGEVFNVATGRPTSLLDLLDALRRLAGKAVTPRFQPARAGDVRDSLADVTLARAQLGFEARTPLLEGLRELLATP